MTARKAFLIISFFFFLYPVTGFEEISINYSFAFFPIITLLLYGKLRKPPQFILLMFTLFALIFVLATLYQFEFLDLGLRRLGSFLAFMTLFAFVFIKIDSEMIAAFKIAIVVISAYFSLISVSTFLVASAVGAIGYEAKDLVGSQRYGFIYLLALWVVFFFQRPGTLYVLGKYPVMGVLLAGLFLTFSRSSIVALMVSFGLFILVSQWQWLRRPTLKGIFRGGAVIAGSGVLVFVVYHIFPLTFTFFGDRLFDYLSSGSVTGALDNPQTSEGTRIHIINTTLDFVMANPLTGSGYLGVWVLPDASSGSAHNQYLDVLLRAGFIGFGAYCFLIFKVLKHLFRLERALFWGLISVLVYGLFHETFKESQGAFVVAFMLGMMAQFHRFKPADNPLKRSVDSTLVKSPAS